MHFARVLFRVTTVGLKCLAAFSAFSMQSALAEPCSAQDFRTRVTGGQDCLVIHTYEHRDGSGSPVLFVLLHGDHSDGSPATSMFRVADAIADEAKFDAIAVAMIRPGYPDDRGDTSTGSNFGRRDSYTPENIEIIANAIAGLKAHYHPHRIVLVGHSGGAAISGVILGRWPGLVDAAVLVACPCDIPRWRMRRSGSPWISQSPHSWVDGIPPKLEVQLIVGSEDDNTPPALSEEYSSLLTARGIKVDLRLLDGKSHNSALRTSDVIEAALRLAQPQ